MIRIFYGEDRLKAESKIKMILGNDHEVIDGSEIEKSELSQIFMGISMFSDVRKILIKDLASTKENYDEIEQYVDTPHEIILFENTLNGTWASVKSLKKNDKIIIEEFKTSTIKRDAFISFKIYDLALENPRSALKLLKENEEYEDPYMMLGSFASNAIKKYSQSKTPKNKRIIKELANIDKLMKTSKMSQDPWMLVETFILRAKDL